MVLPTAPSTYYGSKARELDRSRLPARPDATRSYGSRFAAVCGRRTSGCTGWVHKVWRQLNREGIVVARYTVARLTCELRLRGVVRGRRLKTTIVAAKLPCPADRINRVFRATRPNALWVVGSRVRGDLERVHLRRVRD